MISIILAAALLFAAAQQADLTPQQRLAQAREKYETTRQAAIHINELAGRIHSEEDARTFVDAVAEYWSGHRHLSGMTGSVRDRVAHAEYEAVSHSSHLIPEQRVVDVWNEYVREIDAPEEALVTVAEVHNMRDAMYTMSNMTWGREFGQSLWTMPNLYALDGEGKVFDGCRPLEAVKVLYQMYLQFENVRRARERVSKGILVSDSARLRPEGARPQAVLTIRPGLHGYVSANPLPTAAGLYVQNHGQRDYARLLERLFKELFPKE
jgi:hypothetical protein